MLADIVLGSKTAGVCCLDPTLQCDAERAMCGATTTTAVFFTSASTFALSLALLTTATMCMLF